MLESAAINVYTVENKYKYETYNDWGFRQTDGLTDIILLSHLLMEEHLKQKLAEGKFLFPPITQVGNSKIQFGDCNLWLAVLKF